MNKLFLLMLMMVFPMVASPQGYVNNFKWEENEGTYNGFPLVTVAVGDKHKLQYSYTTNTMGTDIFDVNSGNWVFYENNTVVNAPTVFSMNAQGVVTGVKEGLGALKPTGLILKASGTDRLYIKVVSSYEEQEPNNDFNSANELKGAPTTFGLYNLSDIDYFKVKANAGDKITFKIKGDNSNNKFFGFKWSKFSSTYQSLGSGSLAIDESTGERDIEISSAFTSNYGTGYYYLEIYYDQSRSQHFTYDMLTVQAFLNDKPVGNEETEPAPEPVYDVKFSYDDSNMTATVIAGDNKYTGNIVIPESVIHNGKTYKVTSIGDKVFYDCSGLTSITIPNSVKSIGNFAFQGCSGLTSITIPNSVKSIGDNAFERCSGLTSINVGAGNTVYDSRDNCNAIIKTETNELISGCKNTVIPNSVTSIGDWAFGYCSGLTSVTIPNSVTSIGDWAFWFSGLTSVTIPNSVTSIGNGAFYECSGLTSVTIGNSVTSIGNGAFIRCKGLTTVTIPNSVTSIGNTVFSSCIGLTSITIPNSVKSIGNFAFANCSGLTSITIPNSVTNIGDNAFERCSGLTSITIPDCVTSIKHETFKGCTGLTSVTIGNGVTSIRIKAFASCPKLTDVYCHAVNVPDTSNDAFEGSNTNNAALHVPAESVEAYKATDPWKNFRSIVALTESDPKPWADDSGSCGDNVTYTYTEATKTLVISGTGEMKNYSQSINSPWYSYRTNIQTVIIENGVTSIGNDAFAWCSGLTSLEIPNSVIAIGEYAFSDCSGLTSITIPNSVTSIGVCAFQYCSGLTSITIPNSVTSIGVCSFSNCSGLTMILVESSNPKYDSRNNCNAIIETASNTLIFGCKNTIIPNSVTSIGQSAFSGCSGLTSIEISNSVTSIGISAFQYCSGLTSITIPNSVTSIGQSAFYKCSGLTSITIPNSVTSIGQSAFSRCSGLASVTIGNSVASIGYLAFSWCSGVKDVYCHAVNVPNTNTSAFINSPVENVTLHVPAESIDDYKATDPWSGFGTIEAISDVTDISQLDNIIYVEPAEVRRGMEAVISLKMKNTVPIRGFQFDLYLPEGATVVKSDKGRIQGALSAGRLPDEDEHNLTFSEQADGAIRFLCSSQYNETFMGNEGEIATLHIRLADDMADGDYAIVLKDVKLTETDISKFYLTEEVVSKLTIISYIMGDISGDGKVDVSDYTGVANYIHNNPPAGFNAKAADVDENGKIDVSDYTGIANIIHTGSVYGYSNTNNAPRRSGEESLPDTDVSTIDNVIYISPFTVSAGTKMTLSIKMKNKAAIRGFQFDLYLPEGMTAVKSSKGRIQGVLSAGRLPDEDEHDLTFSEQADGAIRFLCSSQYDETFTGTDGELATLQVNVADGMADGDYALLLKEVKLTETDISKFYLTELVKTTVTVGSSSGIDVVINESDTVWYTLKGSMLQGKPTAKGVYIYNGKKVVIK